MSKRNIYLLTILLLAGTICNCSPITVETKSNDTSIRKTIDEVVQPHIDSATTAGIVIGIMQEDSILFLESYGYADLEYEVLLPQNASFNIGSITKQFTAAAIMQLSERGLLDLDASLDEYLTFNSQNIPTIRQLLTHTSGIKSHTGIKDFKSLHTTEVNRDTVLTLLEKEPFDFEPGSMMLYSNTGYFILGLIIEKVSGMSYEEYITDQLFLKAGMTNSYFCDNHTIKKFRAHGYNFVDGGKYRAEEPRFYWLFAAGGICSTVEDMIKWNQALHRSENILSKRAYKELISPGQLVDGTKLRYAKGSIVDKYHSPFYIGHEGTGSGILAASRYYPEQELIIVTLENSYRRNHWFDILNDIEAKLITTDKERMNYEGNISVFKGEYKGLLNLKVECIGSKLVINRDDEYVNDTLSYIGQQTWTLGEELYSFNTKNSHGQELNVDMIYANFNLTKVKD